MLGGSQLFFAIGILVLFGLAAIVDVCAVLINKGKHYTNTKIKYDEKEGYWIVQSSKRR